MKHTHLQSHVESISKGLEGKRWCDNKSGGVDEHCGGVYTSCVLLLKQGDSYSTKAATHVVVAVVSAAAAAACLNSRHCDDNDASPSSGRRSVCRADG